MLTCHCVLPRLKIYLVQLEKYQRFSIDTWLTTRLYTSKPNMWYYWMSLCTLLILGVHGESFAEQQHLPTFGISSCLFSNKSQLSYHCSERGEKFPSQPILTDKLNTYETPKKLCGHYTDGGESACYRVFLLFFYSQTNGLCVAARTSNTGEGEVRDVSVQLLIDDINHQYFPYCGTFESLSVDNSYTFSCTMDPSLSKAVVTVKGYDPTMRDKWSSSFKVIVEDNCIKSNSKKSLHVNKVITVISYFLTFVLGCGATIIVYRNRKRIKQFIDNKRALFCGGKSTAKSDLLELESTSAMESAPALLLAQSPIPTASNESLNSIACVEEKSQHQQDDSSENSEISFLSKANKCFISGPPPR